MAQKPQIIINQFHGTPILDNFTPGHVNLSFYGKDGSYQGTYGANHAGDLHGILEETETNKVRMSKGSAWYSQTFLSVEEAQFQKALNYARTSVKRTLDKEIGYQLIGGNCVDFATQALCMVNEDLHGYLKDLSALKAYSKLRGASCPVDKSTRQRRSLQQNVDELERLYGVKILPVNVSSIGYPRVFYTDFRHVDDCYATPRYNRRSGPVDKPSNYSWDVVKEFVLTFGTNCPVTRKYVAQNLPIVSPIVINLDGKGIVTKSIFDSNVQFDFDGSGEKYFTGWITKGSGFLFWDPEGDNMIRDASKMFGGGQAGEGFKKLAQLDQNKDGIIDNQDPAFQQLKVWIDHNEDGVADPSEIYTLAELGIEALSLDYATVNIEDEHHNLIGERAHAIVNGQRREMSDVYFKYH